MAKVTGFKCDVCDAVENGNDRPTNWLALKLPNFSPSDLDTYRDICSDKCLLRFAKERNGVTPKAVGRSKNPALSEYMVANGIRRASVGPKVRAHVNGNHAVTGGREDCFICQFELTNPDA